MNINLMYGIFFAQAVLGCLFATKRTDVNFAKHLQPCIRTVKLVKGTNFNLKNIIVLPESA